MLSTNGFSGADEVDSEARKTRRPALTGPGRWPNLDKRFDVSDVSAPARLAVMPGG